MRHRALGRHARYRSKPGIRTYLIALAAALALLGGSLLASGTFAARASVAAPKAAARPVRAQAVITASSALDKAALHRAAAAAHARAAAAATTARYVIRAGDVLSAISARFCGSSARYPDLAASNGITDPDVIIAGHWLGVSTRDCNHAPAPVVTTAARTVSVPAAAPAHASDQDSCTPGCPWGDGDRDGMDKAQSPFQDQGSSAAAPAASSGSDSDSEGSSSSSSQAPAQASAPAASSTYHGSGSMQQCIISRESGGNSQVMNSSGHYGLYQFSASTWAAHGGNPADFGHASVSEQNQVYYSAVAADGYSDWAPYDGC